MIRSPGPQKIIDLTVITADRALTTLENGGWITNEGAATPPVVTLPVPAGGEQINSAYVFPIGMIFKNPTPGVYISMGGQTGARLIASRAGATCSLLATSETTWTVMNAFPEAAWSIAAPSDTDYSADLLAWREVVRDEGGEPSTATMIALDQFIYSEKLYGLWAKTADYFLTWKKPGEHDAVALVSLKQHRLLVKYNGLASNNGFGYPSDGAAQWLDTGFVPSTHHAGIMTTTNQRLAVYDTMDFSANAIAMGASSMLGNNSMIRPVQDGTLRATFGGNTQNFALAETVSYGLSVISRTASSISAWKNSAPLGTVSGLTMTAGLPSHSLYISARNAAGVPGDFLRSSIPFAAVGAALTDAEEVIAYRNMLRLAAYHNAIVTSDTEEE